MAAVTKPTLLEELQARLCYFCDNRGTFFDSLVLHMLPGSRTAALVSLFGQLSHRSIPF